MHVALLVLQSVNLLAVAMAAGGQVFCLMTLVAARRTWAPALGVKVHQDVMSARPDVYMKPMAALSLLTGLAIVLLERDGLPTLLTLFGVLGQVANAVISSRYEWPINREIDSWGATDIKPDRYLELHPQWDQKHRWRTVASMLSLVFFILATVLRQRMA